MSGFCGDWSRLPRGFGEPWWLTDRPWAAVLLEAFPSVLSGGCGGCVEPQCGCSPCRSAHLVSRYRPRAPIIAITRNEQTARQAHLYRGIFPVLCKDPALDAWAEDVDLRVALGMNVGEWHPPPHLGHGDPEHLDGALGSLVMAREELAACVVKGSGCETGGGCVSRTTSDWEMGWWVWHSCF